MRVRHISVTGLFGVFNHEIPLQQEERITILHGLNGVGKTIILRMIAEALTGSYDVLLRIPYECFVLQLDDDSSLRVKVSGDRNARQLSFERVFPDGRVDRSPMSPVSFNIDKDSQFSTYDARWLQDLRRAVDVRLIGIDRHLKIEDVHSAGDSKPPEAPVRLAPVVAEYSEELRDTIEASRSAYVERSQALDQTFPARILAKNGSTPLALEALRQHLVRLGEKQDKLSSLGILSPTEVIRDVPDETDSATLSTLSIYVRDTETKLAFFDDLATKIDALSELVNRRFRFKRFAVRRGHGFVITGPKGAEIPVSGLSSGEQHELVMLYEMLFRTRPDTLVLVDEPEISLHLGWQQELLDDISKLVALTSIDVIIATHSPDIIGRHWDWTVSLEGPEE